MAEILNHSGNGDTIQYQEPPIDETHMAVMSFPYEELPAGEIAPFDEALHTLTPRELEVFQLKQLGYTNKAIARTLLCKVGTVKVHAHSVRTKFGKHYETLFQISDDEIPSYIKVPLPRRQHTGMYGEILTQNRNLTPTELEIATFISEDISVSNVTIAERFGMSINYVKWRKNRIFDKLGICRQQQLTRELLEDKDHELFIISPFDPKLVLTESEYIIFRKFGDDISLEKIMNEFGWSKITAKVYLFSIYDKLNTFNRYSLSCLHAFYVENGLLDSRLSQKSFEVINV